MSNRSSSTVAPLVAYLLMTLLPALAAAQSAGYQGFGADSISEETLRLYAPPPIDGELKSRIERSLDIRAPGMGIPADDGRTLYFGWRVTGTPQIWRITRAEPFPVQITGGEAPAYLLDLTPDGKYLVISRDSKGDEQYGLYLLPTGGGPLTTIFRAYKVQAGYEFVTDDSRYVYYRANDERPDSYTIYRYDIKSGERETVFSREGLWVVADFRPDGRLLLERLKGNLYSEFFEWLPGDEQLTPVLGQDEMEEYSLRYGPRDGEFLVLTNKFGEYRQLFRFVSGSFQPISRKMKHDIDSFSIDHQRQRVLYEVNRDGYSEARAMNALSFDRIRLPETPGAQQVYFGATSPKRISRNCLIFNVEIVLGLRALERIGGHAKNIAGYVIYFATGKDVRHEDLETIETEILPQAE